jgi:hypothetical protein
MSNPLERRGGTCPVAEIGSGAAVFGYKHDYHQGSRELILGGSGVGLFCCEKCKALFEPDAEDTDSDREESSTPP